MDLPLMIFLHGPGMSPPVWQDVVSQINPAQPMVAPWLKGLKPGPRDPADPKAGVAGFDLSAAAVAILDLMAARDAAQADLIGFSLGGLVALRVAAMAPDKIAHVVLVSTPLVPSQKALARQRMALKLMPASAFRGVPKEQVLAGLDALRTADIAPDLAAVEAPCLVIVAESDPLGVASANGWRQELGAVVRTLPGADDNLLLTAPAEVAQLTTDFCSDFLDEAGPPSSG